MESTGNDRDSSGAEQGPVHAHEEPVRAREEPEHAHEEPINAHEESLHVHEEPELTEKALQLHNGRLAKDFEALAHEDKTDALSDISSTAREEWHKELPFWISSLDFVEHYGGYARGGYLRVKIDDVLGGKYKIVHKLGNGGFATVWLARVLNEARYVAIKILVSKAPTNNREVKLFTYLEKNGLQHPNILGPLEVFTVPGQNCVHRCIVFDFIGPSLNQVLTYQISGRPISASMGRSYAKQLMGALAYLHSIGVCHGDLTGDNILLELESVNSWTEDEIYDAFGEPNVEVIERTTSGATLTLVEAIQYDELEKYGLTLTGRLFLTDFGEWFSKDNPPSKHRTPPGYAAPELFFGRQVSEASDVWALGCLIYELRLYRRLVSSSIMGQSDFGAIRDLVRRLGPIPQYYLESYQDEKRKWLLLNDCKFDLPLETHIREMREIVWIVTRDEPEDDDPLKDVLVVDNVRKTYGSQEVEPPEFDKFIAVLRGALQYDPADRLSVQQLLELPWFTDDAN